MSSSKLNMASLRSTPSSAEGDVERGPASSLSASGIEKVNVVAAGASAGIPELDRLITQPQGFCKVYDSDDQQLLVLKAFRF